ncbi:hypothetical protein C0992_008705, partial [Termitomyces sp. T32_za158]
MESYDADSIALDLKTSKRSVPVKADPESVAESNAEDSADESNPIEGCKKHLHNLLVAAGKAARIPYNSKKVPWVTIGKHLLTTSHVLEGWPVACPFPTETVKTDKGKKANGTDSSQGIKDLGSKYGRILLTALRNRDIKLVPCNAEDILNNVIPIISTGAPEEVGAHARGLLNDGRTICIETKTASGVKQKKQVHNHTPVEGSSSPPPAPAKSEQKTSKLAPIKEVHSVSTGSDSDDDRPITELKKRRKGTPSPIEVPDTPSDDDYATHDSDDKSETEVYRSPVKTRSRKKLAKGRPPSAKAKLPAPTNVKATASTIVREKSSMPPPIREKPSGPPPTEKATAPTTVTETSKKSVTARGRPKENNNVPTMPQPEKANAHAMMKQTVPAPETSKERPSAPTTSKEHATAPTLLKEAIMKATAPTTSREKTPAPLASKDRQKSTIPAPLSKENPAVGKLTAPPSKQATEGGANAGSQPKQVPRAPSTVPTATSTPAPHHCAVLDPNANQHRPRTGQDI